MKCSCLRTVSKTGSVPHRDDASAPEAVAARAVHRLFDRPLLCLCVTVLLGPVFLVPVFLVPASLRAEAPPTSHADAVSDQVSFNRDVRGILSDKCFLCHGPDEETREAGLRLDDREQAIDYAAITPGQPDASGIIERISSSDPGMVMPPPETGEQISPSELAVLRRWIEQGADYDQHWAFVPPNIDTTGLDEPVEFPLTDATGVAPWGRNGIDHFVGRRLLAEQLTPSPTAEAATLVRRLHLDLTGLPPSPEVLDRFVDVSSETELTARLDELTEELLESPHFGERWARWWLDAARYADSAGYEKDLPRQVWFYRDYVIDAMNADMPYDRFIVEQIAGDLLPGATQDQRVATGFLRHSMANEEGGADPEQFRVEAMFDRMDAIGKAILGLTTQCAQCHTHKYDPLSQREYYQMFAALNDFHEASLSVYTPQQAKQRDAALAEIDRWQRSVKEAVPDWRDRVESWVKEVSAEQPTWTVRVPEKMPFTGQKFRQLPDGSILSESFAPTKTSDDFSLTCQVDRITAVRVDMLPHPQLPRGGPGRSVDGTGALSEFEMTVTPTDPSSEPIKVKFSRALSDANPPRQALRAPYVLKDPEKDDRVIGPAEFAIDGDPKTAWTNDLGPGQSNHHRHLILIPEEPIEVHGEATLTFTMTQKHGGWNPDDNQNFVFGRFRFSTTDRPAPPEMTTDSRLLEATRQSLSDWSNRQWDAALAQWRKRSADRWRDRQEGDRPAWVTKVLEADAAIEDAWQRFPETATQLVAQARDEPLPTYVLRRGDFLNPGEPVEPQTPAFLHAMPGGGEPARLRMARWMVSDDSPTTARVIVNRIWQAYFGRGLVSTPEDFGFQSSAPSHPALLDYLAVELMDNGWRLQHIHRLITQSATYRQSSHAARRQWVDDPNNELLARGPRFRVEAEMVRDVALAASGLLNRQIGGPPIYPPAPDFLFLPPTSYGPKVWDTDSDGDEYRRSMYIQQYRSVPYPPLQVFDAPKGDAACVRRERSNTPLQSLVVLNEPQFVEAARALAARVLREVESDAGTGSGDVDHQRLVRAFRLCTSRHPDPTELTVLTDLLDRQREQVAEWPSERLENLLGVPLSEFRQLTGAEPTELASWMIVCRTILNLDETITKS